MLRGLAEGRNEGQKIGCGEKRRYEWQGGVTIVASILRPNEEILRRFDSVILLDKGGNVAYFGSTTEKEGLFGYLRSLPIISRLPGGSAPDSWLLNYVPTGTSEAIGMQRLMDDTYKGDLENIGFDYTRFYTASGEHDKLKREILEICRTFYLPFARDECPTFDGRKVKSSSLSWICTCLKSSNVGTGPSLSSSISSAPLCHHSFLKQFLVCIRRAWLSSWRSLSNRWIRTGGSVALAVTLSKINNGGFRNTTLDLMGFLGSVYIGSTLMAVISSIAAFQLVVQEYHAFVREQTAGFYSVGAHVLSWLVVEMFNTFIQSILYVLFFYFPSGLSPAPERIIWFWAFLYLYLMFATSSSQVMALLFPNLQTASMLFCAFILITSVISFQPRDVSQVGNFFYYWSPINNAFEGMVMTQWFEDSGKVEVEAEIVVFDLITSTFQNKTKCGAIGCLFGDRDGAEGRNVFAYLKRWRKLGNIFAIIVICNIIFLCALRLHRFNS